ncbi:MAG: DUF655 domain-containing protein [Candidatus Anstonellales archaeon]
MEDYAYVIDFIPQRAYQKESEALVQLIGEKFFTLLLATSRSDVFLPIGKRVYVGKDKRDEITKIKKKMEYSELSSSAKDNMEIIVKKVIESREKEFVDFFNRAGSITARVHQLELLPGIGKKHVEHILKERDSKPFESFEDIRARVHGIDPVKSFTDRIINELKGQEKYFLFSKPSLPPGRP